MHSLLCNIELMLLLALYGNAKHSAVNRDLKRIMKRKLIKYSFEIITLSSTV